MTLFQILNLKLTGKNAEITNGLTKKNQMEYRKYNLLYIIQNNIKAYNYLVICFTGLNIVTIKQIKKITIDFS